MNKEQLIADIKAMTVLELADLVKALEEEFGVSATAAVAVAGPAAGPAAEVEEKTEFDCILKDTVKKLKKCEIKGGIINGVVTDAAGMNTLADLPSREQLIARLLGSMMSPISKLAIVLGQIQEQKGGSDAAPAEAAE